MVISLEDAVSACILALKTGSNLPSACQTLGNLLQMMGRFSSAVQWHTWAVAPPDDRTEMYTRLGALYGQQECWKEAIAAYEQAIQGRPNYAPALWSLANLHAKLGNTETEIHYRQQALQCEPNWATSRNQFHLGNRLMAEQRSEEAIAYYRGAVDRNPDFFEAHYNLAVALIQQQEWTEAAMVLERSIALEPNYAPSYYALGHIAQQQDDWLEAQTCFTRAVRLDPDYWLAWCAFGEACLKLHEWEEAAQAFQQAIDLDAAKGGEENSWIDHKLGYALLKQQQFSAAVTRLQRSIEAEPEPWSYLHLAEAWMQQQCWQEATAVLLDAIQQQPDLGELFPPLGRSLRHLRQTAAENAGAIVTKLLSSHRQASLYQTIAESLAAHRQYEGAALFYELTINALENDGASLDHSRLERSLQQVQQQQEQIHQTIADHYWKIDQFPQQPQHYTKLAHLLADQGETEAAVVLHRKALAIKGWQTAVDREYRFTRDWFTHNIPVWTQHLQEWVDRPVQAIEVGSFEGMASCWLLDHILTHPDASLVCIDRYLHEHLATNLQRANALEKAERQLGDSHSLLPRLRSESYDLIYLSGDPQADHLYKDAELSWTLLQSGGILIFDYYGWVHQEPIEQRSSLGIDRFLRDVPAAEVLHRGYQVIVRKGTARKETLRKGTVQKSED